MFSFSTRVRARTAAAAVFAVAGAGVVLVPTASAVPADRRTGHQVVAVASAHGSTIKGNAVLGSGRTAFTNLCTSSFNKVTSNDVLASKPSLADAVDLGVIETRNRTKHPNGKKTVVSAARIARGNLFDGAVRFKGLVSVSRVKKTANGFVTRHKVRIATLSIAGTNIPINKNVPPTEIPVPGVGTLTLNWQKDRVNSLRGLSFTDAIRLDLADGTSIRLARSKARLDRGVPTAFGGGAWGSQVTALDLLGSGKTGKQPLPCRGTDGDVRTNNTADISIPAVVSTGVTTSTARTRELSRGRVRAITKSKVADVNFGDGALTIDALVSRAKATRHKNGRVVKRAATRILGFRVNGELHPVPLEGQKLDLPGLGSVESTLVKKTARGVKVVALSVRLLTDTDNPIVVNLGNARVFLG